MVTALKALDIELMVTFWPFINSSATHWDSYVSNNYLVLNENSNKPGETVGGEAAICLGY